MTGHAPDLATVHRSLRAREHLCRGSGTCGFHHFTRLQGAGLSAGRGASSPGGLSGGPLFFGQRDRVWLTGSVVMPSGSKKVGAVLSPLCGRGHLLGFRGWRLSANIPSFKLDKPSSATPSTFSEVSKL